VEDPTPVGVWSPIFRFTKIWATPDNRPTLLKPGNGDTLAFFDSPAFSWTTVIGAALYRFQIANTQWGFDLPLLSVDTISTTYQPNGRLANGEYYWRVVPMDAVNHLGTPSNVWSITTSYGTFLMDMVPELISPADESKPTFTPTFHWKAINGAQYYNLEYTSDETCDFSVGIDLETRQTSYTSTSNFPNDFRYCWRVRVESGLAVGDWSPVWHFQKTWDLKPVLLTPTNFYQTALYPLYSWTPVPGAARYYIEISTNPSFSPLFESSTTANTTYSPQSRYDGTDHYYWRVTPIDGSGNAGLTSEVWEFLSYYNSTAPILVYPLYYYLPNDYGNNTMNPYEDRTIAFPLFIWHRVMTPSPTGGVYASAYRIQVDITPNFLNPIWQYDTKNTSISPTSSLDFNPVVGQDYFWRVCVLDVIGGSCQIVGTSGWSQPWRARFDPSLALTPTNGVVPQLLRPVNGQEFVEVSPLFEWWPYQGATQYQIEVSRDPNFSDTEFSEYVDIPAFSYYDILAQRSFGKLDYGTFYWHVRAKVNSQWGDWSVKGRFQIASQSEWRYNRGIGNADNQLQIGYDEPGDVVNPTYDLNKLYVSQSDGYWFLGFDANLTPDDTTYVLYLDLDHVDFSGAIEPPNAYPYNVQSIPAHQPEYAIFVNKIAGLIDADHTWIYKWEGSGWDYGHVLSYFLNSEILTSNNYVELKLPNAAIGMSQVKSSISIMLFSVNTSTNELMDSVPSDPTVPEIPGNMPVLSRFSAVSERMSLVFPPDSSSGDPTAFRTILPFSWDWPIGSNPSTPFAGSVLEVHLDPLYTNRVAWFSITSNTTYFSQNTVTLLSDIVGDNVYYWRVQPRYSSEGHGSAFGAWTGGWSFRRLGLIPKNLSTSVTYATPTFSWDMAEGVERYHLQVATDPNFSNRVIDITTPLNEFTPVDTLAQGLYYWRVGINRFGGVANDWSPKQQFNLVYLTPTGLSPDGDTVHSAPTYVWQATQNAVRYRLQVSSDVDFHNIIETVETPNTSWTPAMGYNDGTYYWHVAIIDGNGRYGNYSYTVTFYKEYIHTPLEFPVNTTVPKTPTFIWTPVSGAATYIFEISRYPTFYPLYDSIETMNRQYTPTWTYTLNRAYYWRVAMKDRDGKLGPFTDATIIIGAGNNTYLPLIKR
jgi:hypothetical protein